MKHPAPDLRSRAMSSSPKRNLLLLRERGEEEPGRETVAFRRKMHPVFRQYSFFGVGGVRCGEGLEEFPPQVHQRAAVRGGKVAYKLRVVVELSVEIV